MSLTEAVLTHEHQQTFTIVAKVGDHDFKFSVTGVSTYAEAAEKLRTELQAICDKLDDQF